MMTRKAAPWPTWDGTSTAELMRLPNIAVLGDADSRSLVK